MEIEMSPRLEEWNQNLAEAIKIQRKKLGLTQEEVADLSGVSINLLRQVEAGKSTVQMCKLLDVMTAIGLEFRLSVGNHRIVIQVEK
jgi:y4mF family transcriptional regulator